jgi:hypothetical protein
MRILHSYGWYDHGSRAVDPEKKDNIRIVSVTRGCDFWSLNQRRIIGSCQDFESQRYYNCMLSIAEMDDSNIFLKPNSPPTRSTVTVLLQSA